MNLRAVQRVALGLACSAGLLAPAVSAQSIDAAYADSYTAIDLGVTPIKNANNGPGRIAGIVFKDPNTLLVAVNDDATSGEIDAVTVHRGADGHITGFSDPSFVANTPYIDGGLQYAPDGVLLYTAYSSAGFNTLGELRPGSTSPDKTIYLTPLGIAPSVGSLAFVPSGFPGAGTFKLTSWNAQTWYEVNLTQDNNTGTYSVSGVGNSFLLPHYTEGIGYVKAGNPHFTSDSVLLSADIGTLGDAVYAYHIDANGNPLTATRTHFADISNAYGLTFDPITGDMLVSTEVGTPSTFQHITEIRGFDPVPEPAAVTALSAAGLLVFSAIRRALKRH